MRHDNMKIISVGLCLLLVSIALSSFASAQCYSCGGICVTKYQTINVECVEDEMPPCTAQRAYCEGTPSQSLACTNNDPAEKYNERCVEKYDWGIGDLSSVIRVLGDSAAINLIYNNLDSLGDNLGSLGQSGMQGLQNKISSSLEISHTSFDMGACVGGNACKVDSLGKITLNAEFPDPNNPGQMITISDEFNLNEMKNFRSGTTMDVIIDEESGIAGFQINPAETSGVMFNDLMGGSVFVNSDGRPFIISEGAIYLPPGSTIQYSKGQMSAVISTHNTYDMHAKIYLESDVPEGETGVGFITDDKIRVKGVDVAITLTYPNGTVGLVTERMHADDEVFWERPDGSGASYEKFNVDMTKANESIVTLTAGQQGITYDNGTMWACRPAMGSCPFDNETTIELFVEWKERMNTYHEQKTFELHMVPQEMLSGMNFNTCNCDKEISCDFECSCDIICQIEGAPVWMQIAFGYEKYLVYTGVIESEAVFCSHDSRCSNIMAGYGTAYHYYRDGQIVDMDLYHGGDGVLVYSDTGVFLKDDCSEVMAFPGNHFVCIGNRGDAGEICPSQNCDGNGTCGQCTKSCSSSSLIKCPPGTPFAGEDCNLCRMNIGYNLADNETNDKESNFTKIRYLDYFEFEENREIEEVCNKEGRKAVSMYCDKRCGYCDYYPYLWLNEEKLIDFIDNRLAIDLNSNVFHAYPSTVAFEIVSQSNSNDITCMIGSIKRDCPSRLRSSGSYDSHVMICTAKRAGASSWVEIKAVNECGLTNKDDLTGKYQRYQVVS